MTSAYRHLVEAAVHAAGRGPARPLTHHIYRNLPPGDHEPVVPPNKLCAAERAEILAALNSPEFVDLAPLQVYAKLLDEGIYLGSVSTFYRVLQENEQVKERRRWPSTRPGPFRNWSLPHLVRCSAGILRSWLAR